MSNSRRREYNYPVMSPPLEMTLPFAPNCAVHIP
ncbi:MAG: hypothetical protein QOI61_2304 [Actinomycetota bacterium]